jgi:ribosomal protein S18 acetylase RimI-like enzyme
MTSMRIATAEDADRVARLHADSWRRHYRGAYSDAYLDGDVATDRRAVWSARLATPANSLTVLAEDEAAAEDDAPLAGFVHVIFDDDERWGSRIDNLHVRHDRQRTGLGAALLNRAVVAVAERGASRALYLWVLEQNIAAQRFYAALGGRLVEKAPVEPPGGVAAHLTGSPSKLRIAWPDAASMATLRP